MAKRRNYSKNKVDPSVLTMTFQMAYTTEASGKQKDYIDLSQCASLLNRRFYRQGINWVVSSIKVLSPSGTVGQFQVQKLPNTWVMSNSWEKSFRAWQHMIKNATDESGSQSIKGKFLDFKIYADADHHSLGYGRNLLPVSGATLGAASMQATVGQWQPATVEIPETSTTVGASTEYEFVGVGPSNPGAGASGLNAKSLIAGYAVSRALPSITDPNVPDDSASYSENWMLALFNDGTLQDSNVVDMLELTGDEPPYPYENDGTNLDTQYPGGQNNLAQLEIHDSEYISATTVGGKTTFKGGNFPCGLVCFATSGIAGASQQNPTIFNVQIDLVPGNHRGYLCEPMTEM